LGKKTEYDPPDGALEALARCLYPAMAAYFESDEGQRAFADWRKQGGRQMSVEKEADKKTEQSD